MANVSNEQREERRQEVRRLWARGLSIRQIARATRCDWQTAKRDVAAVAAEAAEELDLGGEYRRLLSGARETEAEAWLLYAQLERTEGQMAGPLRLGGLTRVLAAQAQTLAVLSATHGAWTVVKPPTELDRTLAEMLGEALPGRGRTARRLTAPTEEE